MPDYEIYIRDRNLNRVGAITKFSSLEMKINYNDAGGWTLSVPDDGNQGTEVLKSVRAEGGGMGGIIVEREDQIIFSGPIRGFEATGDYDQAGEGENIQFFGIDDTGLLLSRLAMPPPYQAQAGTGIGYDTPPLFLPVSAETALIHFVRSNAAEDAPSFRKIPGLVTLTDESRGFPIVYRARYQNLIDKLKEYATIGAIGFRVIQTTAQTLEFQIYTPEDKTSTVIFSKDFKNLGGYRYKLEAPQSNFVIAGGGDEGTARTFAYAGDEPSRSFYGTWESFIDRRDTTDSSELIQAINTEIQEKTEVTELEIRPLDISPTRYLTDYQVGDKATVIIRDQTIQDMIRSVTITLTKEEGEKIVPVVGTSGVGTTFRLFDQLRNLEARMVNLEKV